MRISLVLPVYNGAPFVRESVLRLEAYLASWSDSHEIVVVDDGSTDGTAEALRDLAPSRIRLVRFEANRGKFAAIKAGMRQSTGRCRIFTDADLPYELEALRYMEQLVDRMSFDLVVGDRVLPGSRYFERLSFLRLHASRVFATATRLLVTGEMFDTQCGLKGCRGEIADLIFPLIRDDRFAGDVELLYIALKYNLAIRRIPVRLVRSSPSSVRVFRDSLRMLGSIGRLRSNWARGLYRSDPLFEAAKQYYWDEPPHARGGGPHG